MMRTTIAASALLILTGCATLVVDTNLATPVGPDRVLNQDYLKADPQKCKVIIKRDTGFFGNGCSHRISIDGVAITDLDTQEKVEIYISPGEHILGVGTNGGLCGHNTASVGVVAIPGQIKAFRTGYPSGESGGIVVMPTEP